MEGTEIVVGMKGEGPVTVDGSKSRSDRSSSDSKLSALTSHYIGELRVPIRKKKV